MMNEELASMFFDSDCFSFVSISWIRLSKIMMTETIKTNDTKMINMTQACFRICIVTITKSL